MFVTPTNIIQKLQHNLCLPPLRPGKTKQIILNAELYHKILNFVFIMFVLFCNDFVFVVSLINIVDAQYLLSLPYVYVLNGRIFVYSATIN